MTFGDRCLVCLDGADVPGVYVGDSAWPGFVVVRIEGTNREFERGQVRRVLPDPRANGVHA